MTQASIKPGTAKSFWERHGLTLLRLWLLLLVFLSAGVVTYVLSAYQVRSRFANLQIGDKTVSIWQLQRFQNEIQSVRAPASFDATTKGVELLFNLLLLRPKVLSGRHPDSHAWNVSVLEADLDAKFGAFRDARNAVEIEIRRMVPGFIMPIVPSGGTRIEEARWDINRLRDFISGIKAEPAQKGLLEAIAAKFDATQKMFLSVADADRAIQREISLKDEAQRKFDAETAAYVERFKKTALSVTGATSLDPASEIRIRDAVSELQSLNDKFWIFGNMLFVPHKFLTIAIAIAAGILGCTAQIGRDVLFGQNASQHSAVEPFFGGLIALVLFIVVKAGVLVAIEPKSVTVSGGELNPFFVAFLGIVAGLLAEPVIERVKAAAQDFLGSSAAAKPRWFIGRIPEDIDQADAVAQLAPLLSLDDKQTADAIAGGQALDSRQQLILSAYLRADPQKLFTDLPPT